MQNPFHMQAQAAIYGGVGVLQQQMAAMQMQGAGGAGQQAANAQQYN